MPSFFSKQISTLIPRDKLNSALSHHTFIMPAVEPDTCGAVMLLYYIPRECSQVPRYYYNWTFNK